MVRLGWRGEIFEVDIATRFVERLCGLMFRRPGPLLLRTWSVHGFGLASDLWAVFLDETMTVVEVRRLRRRRVIWSSSASWVLELPIEVMPPGVGARLTRVP